jgi:hypothetical protein
MSDADRIRPLDELREHRDELCESLTQDLSATATIVSEIAHELDNELAENNHHAVADGVDRAVEALRSVDVEDVCQLARLAAIHFPGDVEWRQAIPPLASIPAPPTVKDPDTLVRDQDLEDYEWDDEVREVLRSNVEDWASHIRHLLEHASEDLLPAVTAAARTGDETTALSLLAGRGDLANRLAAAMKEWELALVTVLNDAPGSAGIAGEQVELFNTWLEATRGTGDERQPI